MTKLYVLIDGGQVSTLYLLSLLPCFTFLFPKVLLLSDCNCLSPIICWHARFAQGSVFKVAQVNAWIIVTTIPFMC